MRIRQTGGERALYIFLTVMACAILGAMFLVLHSGEQMIKKNAPLNDAAVRVIRHATVAHVYLMESAFLDSPILFDSARAYLESSEKTSTVMLEGGIIYDRYLAPLDDSAMRGEIEAVRRDLRHLLEFNYDQRDLIIYGHPYEGGYHSHDLVFANLLEQTAGVSRELRRVRHEEHSKFLQIQIASITASVGFFLVVGVVLYRYLTARKRDEIRIQRLNSILRAIRNVNHLISREKNRDRLIAQTCELLVEARGLHNAWIVLVNETGKPIKQAEAGLGHHFKPAVELMSRGELLPCCLKALKQDSIFVIEEPIRECGDCPLVKMYENRSGLATKLEHNGHLYGFLVVSSPRAHAYDEEEHSLFIELADDIALALHLMNLEQDRVRSEQSLRESEERYRTLAANIPGCDIFLFDRNLRYLIAEGTEIRANGLSADFYEGKTLYEAWDESLVSVFEPHYRQTLEGLPTSVEYGCCDKHYSLSMVPVRDINNEVVGGIALSQNITERKRAEEALKRSESILRHTFEAIPDLISVHDSDFNIVLSNWHNREEAFKRYTSGRTKCHQAYMDSDVPCDSCRSKDVLETGEPIRFENTSAASGSVFEVNVYPVIEENGKVAMITEHVRDITERKRAEEAIRESEEKFRMISEQSLLGISLLQDNVIKYANAAAAAIFDVARENQTNVPIDAVLSRIHPEDLHFVADQMRRKQHGLPDVVEHYPFRILSSDGKVKWVEVYSRTVSYEGKPANFATLVDVTNRKKGELLQAAHLKISEATILTSDIPSLIRAIHESLSNIIDSTNFYVALYDAETATYSFPYWVDQYDHADFNPVEMRHSLTDYIRRTGQPLLIDEATHRELVAKGEVTVVGAPSKIWMGVPLKTADRVLGVVAVQSYTDEHCYTTADLELLTLISAYITMALERKLADEALRESEERLRAMYEQASVGVALISPDGHWLFANERLCEIVGYTHEELMQLTCRDITHPDDYEQSPCLIDRPCENHNRSCTCEKRYLHKVGRVVWVNVSAARITDPATNEEYMAAVIQDITERKEAETMVARYTEQLERANRELESKQAELEEFIYTVSHDLKAPIVSISGFAGLLHEKLSRGIGTDSLRHLDRIKHNATVMESLISDLLELSRIGRMEEPEVTIDFDSLADEIIESFTVTAQARNIRLIKATPLPRRNGRLHRMRQLLTNLVDNAIKYMPEDTNGLVEIGFSEAHDIAGEKRKVYFVRDNGAGIAEEFHERIFSMFQRAPNANGHTEGTGVGLTIVKRIVEKHGGHIWVQSAPGQGATFYFTLPESTDDTVETGKKTGKIRITPTTNIEYMPEDL